MKITTSKYESGHGLCTRIENAILAEGYRDPSCPELHPYYVAKCFPSFADKPTSPWSDLDPRAVGFKDRVIAYARKIGIEVEVTA
jgi:hypothetical protein